MAGFGKPQKHKKSIKQVANGSRTEESIKQSITKYQQGNLEGAKFLLEKILRIDHSNSFALGFLATIEKALGNNKRALKLFKKSINISQDDSDILHNYSDLLKEQDLEKAILLSDKAVHISPDDSDYLVRNGYLKLQAGNLDNALEATLKAIRLDPSRASAYLNLGGIYKGLGNLDQALASTLKSLMLEPDNPTAHMNLGIIYKKLGNLDQALTSTLKSLELKPDNPDALINLGSIYKDLGNLDQALASTLKSLELKPDNPTAHTNLGITYETMNELDSALDSYTKSANLIDQKKKESSLTSMISASAILLQMNRLDDAKKALSTALAITLNKEIVLDHNYAKNNKNNIAYLYYLSKLIPEIPYIKTTSEPRILHIGDSHCLAFTNQSIILKGEKYIIKPSLVKGAKAFHLSEESRTNQQKIGFEKRLRQKLDAYNHIFLSFGEIDCREDEGILLYCRKSGKAIQDIAKATATKYFKLTATSLGRHKDKLVYFGTPAPFKADPSSKESSANNERRLLAITVFNTTLAKQCQESGALFVDVYKLTADKDGYNNNDWMIDKIHLKPEALNELTKTL